MPYRNDTGLVSVTQALSPWMDFNRVPADVLQAACDRGSSVHQAIADYLASDGIPVVHPDAEPYFESFMQWSPAIAIIHQVERRFTCETYWFSGQCDLIATIDGDTEPSLIDFKTSQTAHPSWRLQIAAYRHLAYRRGITTHRGFSLRLSKHGHRAILDEYPARYHRDFATFCSALNAYRYFHEPETSIDWEVLL